ncbi:MAG TPA: hypothetical protein DCG12_00715 [Planctomycetaceae bacterium]|nr:hypothetical protein [Planctomycetaceae bacterium]
MTGDSMTLPTENLYESPCLPMSPQRLGPVVMLLAGAVVFLGGFCGGRPPRQKGPSRKHFELGSRQNG